MQELKIKAKKDAAAAKEAAGETAHDANSNMPEVEALFYGAVGMESEAAALAPAAEPEPAPAPAAAAPEEPAAEPEAAAEAE
jgi:hypothetical protein